MSKVSLHNRSLESKEISKLLINFEDQDVNDLDVSDNAVDTLHFLKLFQTALTSLNLSHNRIAQLSHLPATLCKLNLSYNRLAGSLPSLGRLSSLLELDVSYCLLETTGWVAVRESSIAGSKAPAARAHFAAALWHHWD